MRYFILLLAIITPAFCEGNEQKQMPMTADDCRRLHLYDEDANYKPGVDVHGRPVVSADVNGGYKMPDSFSVPVGFIAGRPNAVSTSTTTSDSTAITTYTPGTTTTVTSSGSNTVTTVPQSQPNNFVMGSNIGIVKLHSDGRMYMDGQPMHDEEIYKLKKACDDIRRRERDGG